MKKMILGISVCLATLFFVAGCGSDSGDAPVATLPDSKTTFKVLYQGPGGHSNGAYGRVNALHAASRGIEKISDYVNRQPASSKLYFNITNFGGGNSVNSIASDAYYVIRIYADTPENLNAFKANVISAIDQGAIEENSFRNAVTPNKVSVLYQEHP